MTLSVRLQSCRDVEAWKCTDFTDSTAVPSYAVAILVLGLLGIGTGVIATVVHLGHKQVCLDPCRFRGSGRELPWRLQAYVRADCLPFSPTAFSCC